MSVPRKYLDLEKSLLEYDLAARISKLVPEESRLGESPYELGDLLISYLEQLGVEYVFGIPGGAIEPLYNALARSERRGGPRAVVARHETGAAFMADGYARNSGKLGVCCATAGPGTTNLITGVASAHDNHTPLLVITAQTSLANFGKGATQESADTGINTVAMFSHCTAYSSMVSHVNQFEQKLVSAVVAATKAPYGPSHLSIPLDVMRSPAGIEKPNYDLSRLIWASAVTDQQATQRLSEKLLTSRKPVFLIGESATAAIQYILNLALKLNAQIVTTPHGKGLISPYHPLFKGVVGFCGHQSAMDVLSDTEVDLVVAVGTALQETATNAWSVVNLIGDKMIHVDESEAILARSPLAQLHVCGDLESTFSNLLQRMDALVSSGSDEKRKQQFANSNIQNTSQDCKKVLQCTLYEPDKVFDDSTPIKPQRVMHLLPQLFPAGTRYLCDSGNSMAWGIHYLNPYDRRIATRRVYRAKSDYSETPNRIHGRRENKGGIFWTCLEYGSMGWAIGSAIGTAMACEDSPVICITGDGAMLMSGGDVTVALQQQLNVIFLILNDSEYGMVKHGQNIGTGESIGYSLPEVDFVKWGESLGIPGHYIKSVSDLTGLDHTFISNRGGPTILDVYIDRDEVPPLHSRLQSLGSFE